MYISIQQPEFFPWLGFFHKFKAVDKVILLDNVQFKKRYFENRNRVRTPEGWCWLRVPVKSKGRFNQLIKDVEIDPSMDWRKSIIETLRHSYVRAPFWNFCSDALISQVQSFQGVSLSNFNQSIIDFLAGNLGVTRPTQLASSLNSSKSGSDLILDICCEVGASKYLSGVSGRDYLDEAKFRQSGIEIVYQNFVQKEYRQIHAENFETSMSAVDAIFNLGPAAGDLISDDSEIV